VVAVAIIFENQLGIEMEYEETRPGIPVQ